MQLIALAKHKKGGFMDDTNNASADEDKLGQEFLLAALEDAPSRTDESSHRRIGFV